MADVYGFAQSVVGVALEQALHALLQRAYKLEGAQGTARPIADYCAEIESLPEWRTLAHVGAAYNALTEYLCAGALAEVEIAEVQKEYSNALRAEGALYTTAQLQEGAHIAFFLGAEGGSTERYCRQFLAAQTVTFAHKDALTVFAHWVNLQEWYGYSVVD